MLRINSIKDNDWPSIRSAIQQLSKNALGPDASPQFTGLTLSELTGNRILYGDASGKLTSVSDFTDWIAASGGLTSADDGDGTLTVGTTGVLEDLNTLGAAASDGQFIVATGAGAFAYESGDTARTSLGLGSGDSPTFAGVVLAPRATAVSAVRGAVFYDDDDDNIYVCVEGI